MAAPLKIDYGPAIFDVSNRFLYVNSERSAGYTYNFLLFIQLVGCIVCFLTKKFYITEDRPLSTD